jgi:pimeloyl-ACP methyl ester carboxylesterase
VRIAYRHANFLGASGSNIEEDHMIKRRAFFAGVLCAAALGVVTLVMAALGIQTTGAANAAGNSPSGAFVELPGVKLWFTDSGGTDVPLILLHANTGTGAVWANQVESFSRAGYRVIAFDRRGWGKSMADPATGPQPGSIAGDLDALVEYLKLDKFHLLGVAGGGFAALDYAASHPEKLRSLVIAASTGQMADKEIADFIARLEIPGLRKLPAVYREVGPSYRGANPDGTKRWIEIEEHARQPEVSDQPLRTPNTFAKIETIPTPTLILAADADLLAPPALMRIWAAHMKNHEWAVVTDAGHAIAWEQPEAFNDKVLEFIKPH